MKSSWMWMPWVFCTWLGFTGCGVGLLQTAKTTPKGTWDINVGSGYVFNQNASAEGREWPNHIPLNFGLRRGITENFDLGASLFLVAGGMLDAKYNFFDSDNRLALSLQGGLAACRRSPAGANVVHLPVRVLASYELDNHSITPYGSVGYGFFWIFDYKIDYLPPPGEERVGRKGYGDGLLMLTLGVELFTGGSMQFLIEYTLWKPVIDDPGDSFSFVDNHLFLAGLKF